MICTKCGVDRPITEYHIQNGKPKRTCKICCNARSAEIDGEFESLVIQEVEMPAEPSKPTELEELAFSDTLSILYDSQERVEYVLGLVLQRLDALEQKVDQLPTSAQVEFKDVAELAQKMCQIWTDARR